MSWFQNGVRGGCSLHIGISGVQPITHGHLGVPSCQQPSPPPPVPQRPRRCHLNQREWRGTGWGGPREGPRGEKMLPHFPSTILGRQPGTPGLSPSQPSGPRAFCSPCILFLLSLLLSSFLSEDAFGDREEWKGAFFPSPTPVLLFCRLQPSPCRRMPSFRPDRLQECPVNPKHLGECGFP